MYCVRAVQCVALMTLVTLLVVVRSSVWSFGSHLLLAGV